MKVAVAQLAPELGHLDANLAKMRIFHQEAFTAGAELVVYPELALTGYMTGVQTQRYALSRQDAAFRALLEMSRTLPLVVGYIERSLRGRIYNAASLLSGGEIIHTHRKVYLPTYSVWEEQKHFSKGKRLEVFAYQGFRVALFICYDFWYPSMVYLAACDDADLLIVIANSARDQEGRSPSTWNLLLHHPAALYGSYVVFCNRVGLEEGLAYWGGSRVVAPQGRSEVVAGTEEELITATLDPLKIRQAREALPLLRDLEVDFTLRELQRVLDKRLVEND